MNSLCDGRRPILAGLVLACLALFAPAPSSARDMATPQKVVTIEGITEYRLGNGLRFLLFPDQSTSNVTVNLIVLVGSRQEGYGEAGMAHLLEHMLFKGTKTNREIPKQLKARGARYNATTSYDRTHYFETLAGTPDNLEFALQLESDRFVNSLIRAEDLASEMTVVRSEFEMGENNPDYILRQRMMAVAYEWHNYGKTVIGNRSDIERVPAVRLQAFYHKFYRPDNAVLVVAGKFDPARAISMIQKYFGPLKNPPVPVDETYTEEPPQDGERAVVLRRTGKIGLVGAMYHIPAAAHPDYAPLQVLADVLDTAPSGRLYKALVETKKAGSVNAYPEAMHDPGLFAVSAQVGDVASLPAVRDQLLQIVEHLDKAPITQEEVDRIKRKLLKYYEQAMNNSNQMATRVLTEWVANGDWRLFFLNRDRIAKVTAADVNRVAREYLRRSNRTAGMFIPTDAKDIHRAVVPPTPQIAALFKNYHSKETVAAGEEFSPTPENIEKRVKRSQIGGVKVAVLPKKSRGGMVSVRLTLRFGNEKSLTGLTTAADFLGAAMMHGTKKHDRQQLQDELDKLGAQLRVSGGAGALSASLRVKRENLPAALTLLREVLREPTFPEKDFDIMKRARLQALEKGLTEPMALAQTALVRRIHPYPPTDIRYTPTIPELIARTRAVTRDQVVKLYQEQLGAQVGELAVVGDFEPEPVLREFRSILGGWKSPVTYKRIEQPARNDVPGGKERILTPDKANAVYVAGEMFALKDSNPDYPALLIGNDILGGGALSSRLGNQVRQKQGLSYAVGSHFTASAKDPAGTFLIFAICNPVNIDKVNRAILEEVDRFLKGGVTSAELDEAKKGYLLRMESQWSRDGQLAGTLGTLLDRGRTFAYYTDLRKKISALTPEDVARAFRKNVQPKRLVVIEAGDFNKKARAAKAEGAGANGPKD